MAAAAATITWQTILASMATERAQLRGILPLTPKQTALLRLWNMNEPGNLEVWFPERAHKWYPGANPAVLAKQLRVPSWGSDASTLVRQLAFADEARNQYATWRKHMFKSVSESYMVADNANFQEIVGAMVVKLFEDCRVTPVQGVPTLLTLGRINGEGGTRSLTSVCNGGYTMSGGKINESKFAIGSSQHKALLSARAVADAKAKAAKAAKVAVAPAAAAAAHVVDDSDDEVQEITTTSHDVIDLRSEPSSGASSRASTHATAPLHAAAAASSSPGAPVQDDDSDDDGSDLDERLEAYADGYTQQQIAIAERTREGMASIIRAALASNQTTTTTTTSPRKQARHDGASARVAALITDVVNAHV